MYRLPTTPLGGAFTPGNQQTPHTNVPSHLQQYASVGARPGGAQPRTGKMPPMFGSWMPHPNPRFTPGGYGNWAQGRPPTAYQPPQMGPYPMPYPGQQPQPQPQSPFRGGQVPFYGSNQPPGPYQSRSGGDAMQRFLAMRQMFQQPSAPFVTTYGNPYMPRVS